MTTFRRNKPKTTTKGSVSPAVYWTMRGARVAREITEKYPKRAVRGRQLVLFHACHLMRETVQRLAPEINGDNWAQGLEIVTVPDSEIVALIHPDQSRKVAKGQGEANEILYVSPKSTSPPYVRVLRSYGPWPARLLPVSLTPRQARVISRTVSSSEVSKLERRIMAKRNRIEADLKRNSLPNVDLTQKDKGEGTEALGDLAFQSLRFEFGINEKLVKHWRPALKAVQRSMNDLAKRYVQYIETGKESVFTVPQHGTISESELGGIDPFANTIMKSAGVS